jgi:hypothetical protein
MRKVLIVAAGLLLVALSAPAAVSAANQPVPGCPAAKHQVWQGTPADGGQVVRTVRGPAIVQPWWNNGHPSVVHKWWNPGVPPWGTTQVKVTIPLGKRFEFLGAGGEVWKYKQNKACNFNLRFEIKNGPHLTRVWLGQLRELGLVRRID